MDARHNAVMDRRPDEVLSRQYLERYEELCIIADRITGMPREVWTKTRRQPCPLVRRVIMLRLSNDGCSYVEIGRMMGLAHSTVSLAMSGMMQDMLHDNSVTQQMLYIFAGRYGYINVTKEGDTITAGTIYSTREEALQHADNNTIATTRIEY